jgi:acyl dehydratase
VTGAVLDVGLVVGPYEGRIDADAAQAYALATNDPNPIYFESDAAIDAQLGPSLREHAFPDDARTRPLGSHTFDVTGDQTFRYGASTDHAPMHIDDEAARQAGFPSKFLQGLCTFAMCSGAVVKIAADGDPARVRRLACRFASPVFPRSSLLVELFDAGATVDGGLRSVAFEATSAGTTVIKHGRAEITA